MATIIGGVQPDGRIKVGAIWYLRDDPSRGTVVPREDIPAAQPARTRGENDVLYYDPSDGTFAFEKEARPLTDEEQVAQRLDDIEARLDALEGR